MPACRRSEIIIKTDGICGGRPRIEGTRITVDHLVSYREVLLDELLTKRLLEAFPHLTEEQVVAALDYYRGHKDEIDALVEDDSALLNLNRQVESPNSSE